MSGKPASVGASRAGVAGAPRVLVYVEPRQLEPGAALPSPPPQPRPPRAPRHALYRPTDQRDLPNTLYYKPLHDSDTNLAVHGSTDSSTHRTEYFPILQQYKDPCPKLEEARTERVSEGLKQDSVERVGVEFSGVKTYQGRIPVESDPLTYQTRCSGPLAADTMPSMQQIALRHGHNQYSESVTVHSEGSNGGRELCKGKSYVNYQILEQSVSHQSIVNQSISILNQQVGVSRGIGSEGDSGNSPQLVRTADGVVLAVLPTPVIAQPTDTQECPRTAQSDSPQTITVPLGWRRIISGTSVLYLSPSGTALSTLPQLREYLQTTGTCKCGLPCPLRPETAFSFDSKVVSKPYQAASGAELTKLCNHKRKLLATLQARAQSPATPPPQNIEPNKLAGTEVAVLKKKMKKRPGFPAKVSVSQLMVQRERPLAEFKPQDNEPNRDISAGLNQQRAAPNGLPLPACAPTQHMLPLGTQDDPKQDTHIQKSSHYITVNNGWITQQKQDGQKSNQLQAAHPNNPNKSSGMPVRGANGQIIGINTAYTKHGNYKHTPKVMPPNPESEQKEKKEKPTQQTMQQVKYQKEDESQTYCGLNQALTPEVMQKINEQQQIFIQQNQKQIEMAMKGYRNQQSDNTNQSNPVNHGQYTAQGQLVIQNGAVVKTNPAKTPPWQVKRTDSNSNPITSPSPKLQKMDTDYEDPNANGSEDSSSSFSSFSSNEQVIPQGMCSRVPPLPQHYNIISQQWPVKEATKKKGKGTAKGKKKNSPTENKVLNYNNGMRLAQETKGNPSGDMANNVPSFMDDPSGYLAQQTALLNNTISRQVGMNSSYDGSQFDGSNHSNFGPQHQMDKVRTLSKSAEVPNMYRNVPNASPSPNTTPDSSVVSDNAMSQCCKGCNVSSKSNSPDFGDNQMRLKYMKHNMYRMELDGNSTSSPKHGFDDNPVTSSTFIERNPVRGNCSPIQAGTVSTSNVSENMQQPEPSPTLSNSSRNTDTPHSSGSNSAQMLPTSYNTQSPAYSNTYKDNFNSNPLTPGSYQGYPYNSTGPPTTQSISGTQMMHFISNHNVNKNLMDVDNISMVGVKPAVKSQELMRLEPRRRVENSMPGYCPPPHMGGGPAYSLIQACYVQTFVTTMASGFSVTRDTVTSVLAGKANTVTTSINAAQANFIRPPPPPSVNMATTYAIPNNQPDPFLNSVNLPTSYPLHIAGTTAQNMISKSPLEMVQNVIGSIPSKSEGHNSHTASHAHHQAHKRTSPGQILISSTGQIIVPNNQMPPPPPKMITTVASGYCSVSASNVSASGQSVTSASGGQSIVNQPTVVVNTLQAPFVIQPPMMAVDGQVMQQNTVMPPLVSSNIVAGQSTSENTRQMEVKSHQSFMQGLAMVSPESLKKRSKKKKNMTNMLQITAPQQHQNNIMVHSSPQHNSSPQFSPRSFQLSPNNNISPTPMLQALTIMPGKSGTPAHIVMNGQGNSNNFGSQQIITNTSPSQQINLLQPVNLINNGSGVMPNFPAFQQFIVPNLGGMMMTADGTTIIQDNSTGMPMQLQLQTVNGQNVLTPVQNSGVFTGANGGVVIRAQNQQGKIIQSQHSPGAQFLSPNSQVMMNSPNFNGQLSPLLANLSPTNVSFNTSQQVRSGNMHAQEYIQTNQMGQAVILPVSPKQTNNNRTNSTFVHQNTTIVQQQTTLVSNSHNTQMSSLNLQGGNQSRLSIDPNMLIGKQIVQKTRNFIEMPPDNGQEEVKEKPSQEDMKIENSEGYAKFMSEFGPLDSGHVRHSVSTQTLRKSPNTQAVSGSSPPDTTTHSPLGALEAAASPRLYAQRCVSTQGNYADTTTKSPEPTDANSSAMVQCVSSSEQDMADARDHAWPAPRNEFHTDESHNMMSNMAMMHQNRPHNPVESSEIHYNQNMNIPPPHNPHVMPMASNYYERTQTYKRKNDFGDGSTYRSDKIMRTSSYNMVHAPKDNEYDMGLPSDKPQVRHYQPSGSGTDTSVLPRGFDRHNLGSSDDAKSGADEIPAIEKCRKFDVGDLVWGPVKGYPSWPGKLQARNADGRWSVRWFGGDKAAGCVDHSKLLTLSEGLEAHHAARTKHRKSRKLNTLLENAIQEAMAELDKKSERIDSALEGTSAELSDVAPITETPKRTKKLDKVKAKDKLAKKNPVKIAPRPHKTGEGARLRSAR